MERFYLLTYADNWADEMDLDGHVVLTNERYNKFKRQLEKLVESKEEIEFYVGTNEEIYYEGERLRDVYSVKEISTSDYLTLKKLGLLSIGFADNFVEFIIHYEH